MKHRMRSLSWRPVVYRLSVGLALAQVVLIFLSWLLSAAMPQSSILSLLSARGIRWFFGYFVVEETSALLLWIILGAIAWGGIRGSNLLVTVIQCTKSGFSALPRRVKLALVTAGLFGIIQIVFLLLLTVPPQAVLLSVTGTLSDSSFSASIIPCICFLLTTVSIVFGLISGTLQGIDGVCRALCSQHALLMPLLLLYVMGSMLVSSVYFVFFSY